MRGTVQWRELTADDERRLQAAMLGGSRAARDELIQCTIPWVKLLSKSIHLPPLANKQDRDDLQSEMLLGVVRNIHLFDPDRGRLTTFVRNAALSRAYTWTKHMYRKRRPPTVAMFRDFGYAPKPVDFLESELVAESIRSLPTRLRRVLDMQLRENLTLEQIGARCGFSRARAGQIIKQCHKHLAKEFERKGVV
jgi:RNA polymerase sigma factor (sigma-70 family)